MPKCLAQPRGLLVPDVGPPFELCDLSVDSFASCMQAQPWVLQWHELITCKIKPKHRVLVTVVIKP